MNPRSPILSALADRYERSQAGRTGKGSRDLLVSLEDLLIEARCSEGDARAVAERELREAEASGYLTLVPLHPRDPRSIDRVRFSAGQETALFAALQRTPPSREREALARQFAEALSGPVPDRWLVGWRSWCEARRVAALGGESVAPFDRRPSVENERLLQLLRQLLDWKGESLVRFASCVLCGNSKELEARASLERDGEFAGQLRGTLGRLLEEITSGEIRALDDLGILPSPRFALVHGPLRLRLDGRWLDLGQLHGPVRIAATDLARAEEVATTATRCLTVENETSFHELAKLRSGELLVHTSYPGSGTLLLLSRLPRTMEFWHFGDSDAAGFDILRVLRAKSGLEFRPFHMQPGRMPFEQESLGAPRIRAWPFYD
ncbi:MAG: hypothetical protein IT581_14925 [Verrucomicrobiales bacterium]|nr:hypothetical protein [Verrucomicrobiales bacterium]